MPAALERLERDVHHEGEEQQDEPECEREPEVALARVQRHRGREGAGLAADVAAHGHGGSDLRDDVAEGGRDHRREGEPGFARHRPRAAPAAGAERLGGAADAGIDPLDRGGGERGGDRECEHDVAYHDRLPGVEPFDPPSGPRRESKPYSSRPTTTVGNARAVLTTVSAARRPQKGLVAITNPTGMPSPQANTVAMRPILSVSSVMPYTSTSPESSNATARRRPSPRKSIPRRSSPTDAKSTRSGRRTGTGPGHGRSGPPPSTARDIGASRAPGASPLAR